MIENEQFIDAKARVVELYKEASNEIGKILDEIRPTEYNRYQRAGWVKWRKRRVAEYGDDSMATIFPTQLNGYHSSIVYSLRKIEEKGVHTKQDLLMLNVEELKSRIFDADDIRLYKAMQDFALAEFYFHWNCTEKVIK